MYIVSLQTLFFLQKTFNMEISDYVLNNKTPLSPGWGTGGPHSVGVCWDFEFTQENNNVKINKICAKFYFWLKI